MKIHEYQAKSLLARYGIPVLKSQVADDAAAAGAAADALGYPSVVKAQVHAGGRGKGGGIRLVKSRGEAERAANEILGRPLVTPQTGPEGKRVKRLLVEEGCAIDRELYAAVALDRRAGAPVIIASPDGGMDIEEVARQTPDRIFRVPTDPALGFLPFQARALSRRLGLSGDALPRGAAVLTGLARAFTDLDLSLAEINPLVVTREARVVALDSKVVFDDNALWRHKDAEALRDPDEEDPLEARARKADLSYIKLSGNIGCMVNGAGLAMATMDIIKLHGGAPANFLDVGGGADKARVTEAFRILLYDPKVQAVLVNIFGGIMKCDVIAEGVVAAAREVGLKVPLVVRLEGTNVERGRELLSLSGLALTAARDMEDAAKSVVAAAAGAGRP